MLKSKSSTACRSVASSSASRCEHVAFQLRHRVHVHLLGLRKAVERAQQIAEGVAQLAVLVGHALEDLVADAVILGVVDRQRPQPDDVGAVFPSRSAG